MVPLFIEIYNKKIFCAKLIKEFYKINKDKENENNMDRKESLNNFISTFDNISSKADDLIKNNGYDAIQFYGIILCYLNYYDYENFIKYFNKLKKDKCEALYEILLTYDSNFLNPIEQDIEFFVKFIQFSFSKKKFDIFEIALNYILDIETFIVAMDITKEQIIDKYKNEKDHKTIKMNSNLLLKKKENGKEMDKIISSISSIINYSKKKEILLMYFDSNFFRNILKYYIEPNQENINICFRLREIFIKYNELVNILLDNKTIKRKEINENEKKIRNDLNKYFVIDEFAFILHKNIKNIIKTNKKLTNFEILELIKEKDLYYIEDKYKNNRESDFFDYIRFDQIDEDFIEILKFEKIFQENIMDYLNKMISKKNNTFKFGVIMDLINIEKIEKDKEFLSQLKQKYEFIIQKEINYLTGEKLNEAIKTVGKFIGLLFI